jgi:hypothetical protein
VPKSFVVIPRAGLDPAFDRDLLTLPEIAAQISARRSQVTTLWYSAAPYVAGVRRRGDRKLRDVLAARESAHLGIPG